VSVLRYLLQHPPVLLLSYLLLINLALFLSMGADKARARGNKRRIPEARLFLLAILGGSIGGIAGIYCFRHKTKHKSFTFGFPAILVFELAAAALIMFI